MSVSSPIARGAYGAAAVTLLYGASLAAPVNLGFELPAASKALGISQAVATNLAVGLAAALLTVYAFHPQLLTAWMFVWNCFLRPLGASADQKGRLDSFYQGQAMIYDKTRSKLLRGRGTMLRLSAAQLKEQRRVNPQKRLIWIDIGGGTGWNIEEMDKYFPIADFDAVYLVDLCEPLLDVARARFAARGWKNVQCLLQNATEFVIPSWETEGVDPEGGLDFVTFSYSLSMMPEPFALLDRVNKFLTPEGVLGVCDFYVSSREKSSMSEVIGDVASRQCTWLARVFWLHWFEFDHIDLHPSRRNYVEHLFGTVKSFNARNRFLLPFIQIPYYISIMTSRKRDTSLALQAYEVDSGNTISASSSPILLPANVRSRRNSIGLSNLDLGAAALDLPPSPAGSTRSNSPLNLRRTPSIQSQTARIDLTMELPLTSFHYSNRHFRVPYLDLPVHKEFRSWIYGFAWEDPNVDMKFLNLTPDDEMMVITSAGCNALHYAIAAGPKRIHAVDMNPCQGHLLELKLAGILALEYEDFWALFGEGKHPNFRMLLDTKLSPFLSSHAYQFWRKNDKAFSKSFYMQGYSGLALLLAKYALGLCGAQKHVHDFCSAPTLEAQRKVWETKLRRVFLNPLITNLAFANPAFLWNALGVPMNQMTMFLNETTTKQYAIDTLDPVALNTHMSSGAYHYVVCLEQKYYPTSCPLYLTPEGFNTLKKDNGALLDTFRLHTNTLIATLKQLGPNSLTILWAMDHLDWFNNTIEKPVPEGHGPCDLTLEIRAMKTALKKGGRVFCRSSAITPWYTEVFKNEGFKVKQLQAREIGSKVPIDNVNMYASLWQMTKK